MYVQSATSKHGPFGVLVPPVYPRLDNKFLLSVLRKALAVLPVSWYAVDLVGRNRKLLFFWNNTTEIASAMAPFVR